MALLAFSCSSMKKDKKGEGAAVVIRYVNLRTVYAFLLNRDEKAERLNEKRNKLAASIEEEKTLLLKESGDRDALYRKINSNRQKLEELAAEEESHKARLLNRIKSAVKIVAESSEADFVLNLGDEVIYGKKKFDVTEDVLKELERIESRSDPVSR